MHFRALVPVENPRVELIPLIDVIFLLLIFFLYSVFNLVELKGIPLNLANSATSISQKDADLIISINEAGHFYLDSKLMTLEMVLKAISKLKKTDAILIRADDKSPTGMALKILDAARLKGIEKLAIQTNSNPSQK